MTRHHNHDTLTEDAINLLIDHGLAEGLPRIAELLLNAAMRIERSAHLGAGPYERNQDRNGYANGLKERQFATSLGKLSLKVPQVRDCAKKSLPISAASSTQNHAHTPRNVLRPSRQNTKSPPRT